MMNISVGRPDRGIYALNCSDPQTYVYINTFNCRYHLFAMIISTWHLNSVQNIWSRKLYAFIVYHLCLTTVITVLNTCICIYTYVCTCHICSLHTWLFDINICHCISIFYNLSADFVWSRFFWMILYNINMYPLKSLKSFYSLIFFLNVLICHIA